MKNRRNYKRVRSVICLVTGFPVTSIRLLQDLFVLINSIEIKLPYESGGIQIFKDRHNIKLISTIGKKHIR